MRRLISALLLTVAAGCAGGGAPTSPTTAEPTLRLTGSIRDASANILLSDVTVSANGGANNGKSTVTGADGRYTLTNLVRGAFTLRTQHAGYEDHVQEITITNDTNIDIRLIPRRTINSGWSQGQLFFTAEGARVGSRITTVQLSQSGTTVTGVFSTADGGSGTLSGRVEGGRFTGSIQAEVVFGSASRHCRGTASNVGGVMTPDTVALAADSMVFENCAGSATNIELTLQP